MTTEYGIFTTEGQLERDFYSAQEAEEIREIEYPEEEGAYVAECCEQHPDEERDGCRECDAEDEGEEEEVAPGSEAAAD